MSFLIVLFLVPSCLLAQNQRYVTVTTPQGAMQGAKLDYGTNTNDLYYGSAYSFLGVPYAQPPTGQLRFSEPVPMQPSNQLYDATYLRGRCPQAGVSPGPVSEDCLYLNIFTTQVGNTTSLNAVMIFIGGEGGFTRGGANEAEIPGTVRNLASRGVVVVTVQYRLGALGFFNLANSGVPANLGMQDQVMALQWIQENIRSFGGDPNRMTLCGHADGACAVAAHALSPMSNDLFQQAILQSGSIYTCYQDTPQPATTPMPTLQRDPGLAYQPLNQQQQGQQQQQQQQPYQQQQQQYVPPYTTTPTPRQQTVADEDPSLQLAMAMCNVSSDQLRAGYSNARLRTCLQSLTVDVFVQFQGYRTSKWVIVRDNSFMPGSPQSLSQNARRIPMIIGTVQDEDADYVFRMIADGSARGQSEQQLFDGWFVDFAKKNKINGTDASQVKNIIENNYGITQQPQQNQQFYNPPQNGNNGQNQNYQIVSQSNANTYNPNNGNNQMQPTNNGYQQQTYSNTQFSQSTGGNNQQTMQYLQVISKISSDANGVSQSVSQVNLVQQQGADTRLFQFTHVSELGRSNVPNTGDWKPVFRGQDQYFLFMSQTVWTTGQPTAADMRVANEMGQKWTDFAKTGQVQNWQSTPPGQYNYCNLNAQPTMQQNYAPTARAVFNDQVYPIVQQATNTAPFIPSPVPSPPLAANQNANVMVHNSNGSSSWSVSFSIPASSLLPFR
uniref:Carboxylesterase type B domain-containing protein n=1 Tax=Pristionchus pacificus TaxID=54126 RepID=A0A8R1Z6R8_PRIPA